ncbi:hypothetical protein CKY51_17785 [Xanthomonas maliensis]|nr:hypothetical protein CKY51_17785 [Xanthomonas maliensis]
MPADTTARDHGYGHGHLAITLADIRALAASDVPAAMTATSPRWDQKAINSVMSRYRFDAMAGDWRRSRTRFA